MVELPDPLKNLFMWPVNMVRDFPRRSGRLLGTIVTVPSGEDLSAHALWFHALLCYLFDLVGGPEIIQFFQRLVTETRPLTESEIGVVSEVLGPKAIRYRDVLIAQRGLLRFAFQINKNRAFATWYTINLPDGKDENLALLVHELTHTYQYERVGTVYIGQGLWVQAKLGALAYDYGGPAGLLADQAAGKHYKDYNREQQGQISQDYCTLFLTGRDTTAYEPYIVELRKGLV